MLTSVDPNDHAPRFPESAQLGAITSGAYGDPADENCQMAAILDQVCGALTEAHGCGLVHRDIKPANIILREARLSRHLSQQELARKLGLHQRQISDLERAAMDPRLSTIHNVARALDLELILIPRPLISAVEGLQRAGSESAKRPMYALGDDDAESDPGDPLPVELGSTGESGESVARPRTFE